RLHAVTELSPRPPRAVVRGEARVPSHALRVIASKQLSHGCELEPPVAAFSKQAQARQRPQQAIQAVFRDSGFAGEVIAAPPTLRDPVRDADFDDGADRLTDPLPDDHLGNNVTRAGCGGLISSTLGHESPFAICRQILR